MRNFSRTLSRALRRGLPQGTGEVAALRESPAVGLLRVNQLSSSRRGIQTLHSVRPMDRMSKLRPWDETIGARFFSTDKKAEGAEEELAGENGEGEEAAEEGDELTRLRTELEEKDAKVADLTDKILRTMAEMENLRERTRRQAEDAKKFAIQGFCKDLLDVADNLDRAIATVGEDNDELDAEKVKNKLNSFVEGVVMTEKQLSSVFRKNGVTKFNPEGEEFDANSHMALFNVPIPEGSDAKVGTIAAVTKTGYTLHDRIIRAAEVGVYQ